MVTFFFGAIGAIIFVGGGTLIGAATLLVWSEIFRYFFAVVEEVYPGSTTGPAPTTTPTYDLSKCRTKADQVRALRKQGAGISYIVKTTGLGKKQVVEALQV